MSERRSPVFLERQSYRRRRLIDSIRMLPVIGALLWAVPLLWPSRATEPSSTVSSSDALIYVFGCWFLLVLLSLALARALKRSGLEQTDLQDSVHEES